MENYSTIKFNISAHNSAWIYLNRPDKHNAFNEIMIQELRSLYNHIKQMDNIRVVILTGAGASFCAGADLHWMSEVIQYSQEQNLAESLQLAELLYTIYSFPKPTIAMVNGAAIGGGVGLVAATDIIIASDCAKFGFSEVKLGLAPACISPYIIHKIGENKTRELFLTGERFDAPTAHRFGLANKIVPHDELQEAVNEQIKQLTTGGPRALATCKELLENVTQMPLNEAKNYTAQMIAKLRVSDEGQEGMNAFFEKRKPKWSSND